ncbi:MAG TPA: phage holin family protein [Enteractinococcus helveticum]|uniref:Phage holin family protein n=1 Tax=Enteractinococcus helveticum TaxID=1837282 RepID=A0A921FRD1_9MICC|nr:phage holin family protein [Enteractinococcus helveticum]HJF15596.1 phage holin family protein [Enteractinococcus helveticum]
MTTNGAPRVTTKTRMSSLLDLLATMFRLVPKQLSDNLTLLSGQLKSKGIRGGIGVGVAVSGLLFGTITFISLVVALIGAFMSEAPLWQTALWVALGAFVVMLILLVIGLLVIRSTFPLVSPDLVRGIKHDIGYVLKGNAFDPVEFDRLEAERRQQKLVEKQRRKELAKRAQQEQKKAVRRGEAADSLPQSEPTDAQLRHRMELRRRHLGDLRSGVDEKTDLRAQLNTFTRHASGKVPQEQVEHATSPLAPHHSAARAGEKVNDGVEFVKDRWQPLTVLGASVTTAAVLLRKLRRR